MAGNSTDFLIQMIMIKRCPGKHGKSGCLTQLYRCNNCGSIGCDKVTLGACTNQVFHFSKCVICGATGKKEPLTNIIITIHQSLIAAPV